MNGIVLRPIRQEDNTHIARLIREVLIEHGVPKVGTAYEDESLDNLSEFYSLPGRVYYVAEKEGEILGGAGVAPLENGPEGVCELQKMYFSSQLRGRGIGFQMLKTCLEQARNLGYDNCYLETMPYMEKAQNLYRKFGFENLDAPLGDTGHYSCQIWMLKSLK